MTTTDQKQAASPPGRPRPRHKRKSAAEQALANATALLNSQPTTTFEWLRWALLLPLPQRQKIILAFIASRAGSDGRGAYPSKAMLALVARCGERSIHRHIVTLRNLGLLSWEKRNSEAGRETNLYALHWKSLKDIQGVSWEPSSPTAIPAEPNEHYEGGQRTFEGSPTHIHECPTKTLDEDSSPKAHPEGRSRAHAHDPADRSDSAKPSEPLSAARVRRNPRTKEATSEKQESGTEKPLPTRPLPNRRPERPVGNPGGASILDRARAVLVIATQYGVSVSAADPLDAAAEVVEIAQEAYRQNIFGAQEILIAAGFRTDSGRLIAPAPGA